MAPVTREPPSPTIPIIVLVIVGTMVILPSLMAYNASYSWKSTMSQAQTHFALGAFLIPVCLFIIVQSFGLPQVNRRDQRAPSPFMQSITDNLTTSIVLVIVIFALLMLIPLRSSLLAVPW